MFVKKRAILSLFVLLFIVQCDQVAVDYFSTGPFRVLAVAADQPEVDASVDTSVSITPWISDLEAGPRQIDLVVEGCLDPGLAFGALAKCDPSMPTYQSISYASFNTSSLSTTYFTGAMPSFSIIVPKDLLLTLPAEQQFNGVDYIVTLGFTAGSETVSSFKRIVMSTNPAKNQNPQLDQILVNGSASDPVIDQSDLEYTVTSGFSEENYDSFDSEGNLSTQSESYLTTWFVNAGTLRFSRTDPTQSNKYTLNEDTTEEPFVIAVLRDNRGGVDVGFRD